VWHLTRICAIRVHPRLNPAGRAAAMLRNNDEKYMFLLLTLTLIVVTVIDAGAHAQSAERGAFRGKGNIATTRLSPHSEATMGQRVTP